MPDKCSEVFKHTQLRDSHLESTQFLTPGAARSQPSLEGERGRLTALVFLSSEDGSSATVFSRRSKQRAAPQLRGCAAAGELCGDVGKARSPAPEPQYLGESISHHRYHHFPPSSPVGLGRAVQNFIRSTAQRKGLFQVTQSKQASGKVL